QITIYSSRTQSLVQPLLEDYAEQTGQDITVRYMSTASLVATLQEEGDQTPADVVYLAEPGGLGALSEAGLLSELPDDILNRVEDQFRAANGEWVGVSGRAKVVVYNRENINPEEDLPDSIMDFTDPQWEGRIGWAPTHGEWQALLTAIRVVEGEEAAREWVRGIQDNDPRSFPNLISIVQGAAEGDVDVGFVNHYYAHRFIDEAGEDFGARNYYLGAGDAGSLVNVSGAAIPDAAEQRGEAEDFIEFLLGEEAQEYFTQETKEYPLIDGVEPAAEVPPLSSLSPPDVDLGEMSDVQGTIELLRSEGIIP
ncbi:MAG: iron ABC transporter substrate-binding protein, partial [Chloroflexota bacterium]